MDLTGERLENWTSSWPAYDMLSDNEMDLGGQIIEWLPGVSPEEDQEVSISNAAQDLLRSNE